MDEQGKFRLADALGARHVEDLATASVGGPLDLLALREEIERRLRPDRPSSGEKYRSHRIHG